MHPLADPLGVMGPAWGWSGRSLSVWGLQGWVPLLIAPLYWKKKGAGRASVPFPTLRLLLLEVTPGKPQRPTELKPNLAWLPQVAGKASVTCGAGWRPRGHGLPAWPGSSLGGLGPCPGGRAVRCGEGEGWERGLGALKFKAHLLSTKRKSERAFIRWISRARPRRASQRARSTPPRPSSCAAAAAGSAGGTCCLNCSNPRAEPPAGGAPALGWKPPGAGLRGNFTLFFPLGQGTRSGLEPKRRKGSLLPRGGAVDKGIGEKEDRGTVPVASSPPTSTARWSR